MELQHSLYHSCLRIAAATLACTLVFVSGSVSSVTSQLTYDTTQYVAMTINASAGVAPTELNQITAALTEQQTELDERAAALTERELALGLQNPNSRSAWSEDMATLVNTILLLLVLILLSLNYVLDFRYRHTSTAQAV